MMTKKSKIVDLFGAGGPPNPEAILRAKWRTTDIANAAAFIDLHGHRVRHAHHGRGWHTWHGGRWEPDTTQTTLSLAQESINEWWAEVGTAGSSEEREILAGHFLASGKRPRIEAMLKLAAADRRVALGPDAFDRNPWLLTVPNGTIDLRTGVLGPHNPDDLISQRSPVPYQPTATCPRFLDFLRLIFNGDQSLVDFIQRAAGYSATGSVRDQCLFFLWGGGANGKSTLLTLLHAVLGDHAVTAAPALLMASKFDSHPTELASLLGARLVSASETEQDRRLREVRVKALTGGDPVRARFMNKNFFEFIPTHTFWIAGNHKPVVVGQDPGIWRRIHLVPFTVNLEEQLKDTLVRDFAATLADELPGILAWIVNGALHWYADGLRPPAIVSAATAAYRAEMDAVGEWFDENCQRGTGGTYRTPFKVLYEAYVKDAGAEALPKRLFSQELDRLGIHNEKVGGIKVRCGCRLRSQANDGATDQD